MAKYSKKITPLQIKINNLMKTYKNKSSILIKLPEPPQIESSHIIDFYKIVGRVPLRHRLKKPKKGK